MAKYVVKNGKRKHSIEVSGRYEWALECLLVRGGKGCTPICTPGPRWAAYVHFLRDLGVKIETIHERHGGPFPGSHARYVLLSHVQRVDAHGA